jgi:hypothetical protein
MNSRILVAFLVAGSMSGCVIYGGGGGGGGNPPGNPGDVTFEWTFDGGLCSSVPDVKSVRISIPGETLQNGGVFPCLVTGHPGIVLQDFDPGSYSFTIDALDYSGNVIFVDSGAFTVNGNVVVLTDLQPAPGANSYAYLAWKFPSSWNCAEAEVSWVRVSIDYGDWTEYPCTEGFNTGGVVTDWLSSGHHTIELEGLGADGYRYFRYAGSLTTSVGSPIFVEYNLPWSVGGVSVKWQLNGGVCSTTANSAYVNFWDVDTETWVYLDPGDPQDCIDGATPVLYNYLQAGTYEVWATAFNSSAFWMVPSSLTPLQRITVVAGQFVDSTSPSVVVQLY